jgi:excinuclease UvrABC nuclease subunit
MMDHYESAMREAAAAESFEQAAIYRDIWQQLQLIHNQLQRLRDVQRDFWYIYPLRRGTATPKWMLIAGGRIAALVAVPRSAPAARKCLTLLEQTFEQRAITAVEDYDHVRLVTAWFRQRPDQQRRLLEPNAAREICLRQLDGNPSRTSPRSRKTA